MNPTTMKMFRDRRKQLQGTLDATIRELASVSDAEQAYRSLFMPALSPKDEEERDRVSEAVRKAGDPSYADEDGNPYPFPMGDSLKGCPFCGEQPFKSGEGSGRTTIMCSNARCAAVVNTEGNTEAHATARWNKRA